MMRRISAEGRRFLEFEEGRVPVVYPDSVGHPTIGIGHKLTQSEISSGKIRLRSGVYIDTRRGSITDEEINIIFASDVHRFEVALNEAIVPEALLALTQRQFDALVSWAFNVGDAAARGSTLVRRLNAGRFVDVPFELKRWNKSGGKVDKILVGRRAREAARFSEDLDASG